MPVSPPFRYVLVLMDRLIKNKLANLRVMGCVYNTLLSE